MCRNSTMSSKVRKNLPLFKVLMNAKPGVVRGVIKEADKDIVDSLSECCLNVLSGRVRLSPSQKKKLSRHKNALRTLAKRGVSVQKRKAMLQKGGFLGALLKPIVGVLGKLLLG